MKLGLGWWIVMNVRAWPADMDPDERTARNSRPAEFAFTVTELEWTKPHQRLIVRGMDRDGRDVSFTRRELELNGARNG